MLVPVPARWKEQLGDFDPAAVVPPKDAATIAVVRDGSDGIEAFLMRRHSGMAFAAGMYVFPGGGVQDDDGEPMRWVGPAPEVWAQRFSCDPDLAGRLVVAAVRETFEETGVLLAGPDEDSIVGDTTDLAWAREALEAKELSFARFLADEKLVLRADLLGAWAHWITPALEPRRYDTRFFVAALPRGQRIGTVSTEADKSLWAPLSEVLARVDAGGAAMMPPTVVTCRELSTLSATEVLAAAAEREIRPIEPQFVQQDGQWWLDIGHEGEL
ncbi:MAG: NUDIX hydrolase [Aeromicrobium sp.]